MNSYLRATFAGVFIGLFLLLLGFAWIHKDDWQAQEAISNWVLASLAIGTIVFAYREHRHNLDKDRLDRTVEIIKDFHRQDIASKAEIILNTNNPQFDDQNFIREMVAPVLGFYETLGMFVESNRVDYSLIYDYFLYTIPKTYERLSPFINKVRENQNEPRAWEYFERLKQRIMSQREVSAG